LSDIALEWMADEARALELRMDARPTQDTKEKAPLPSDAHNSLRAWFCLAKPHVRPFLLRATQAAPHHPAPPVTVTELVLVVPQAADHGRLLTQLVIRELHALGTEEHDTAT
jgi:hypothetical protein